ncbi:MAG: hypothetical protein K9J24_06125 [Bacteroidales bacterium]|nr:hypothetical protein [Bacteroidales bacterium]
MSFHNYSKEIVQEYLNTVAYVDDLIFKKKTTSQPKKLKDVDIKEVSASKEKEKSESNSDSSYDDQEPNIDPVAFTKAFTEKGIHCNLIELTNPGDPLEPIKQLLKRTDVAVLDWQMHQDLGERASDILFSLLEDPKNLELRLIIIYTEDEKFNTILPETIIPQLNKKGFDYIPIDEMKCKYIDGHTKIVVFKKKNGGKGEYSVSDEELPSKIIEELSTITEGLVSNTVLKSVSLIRKNSHRLLGIYNKSLDNAYLVL